MTIIDEDSDVPTTAEIVIYSITCAVSLYCCYKALWVAKTRKHYESINVTLYLFVLCCFVLALESAMLACTEIIINNYDSGGSIATKILYVLNSLLAPCLVVISFEICYLVHKRRSVNFCGMVFDRGQRVRIIPSTWIRSFLLRHFMRLIAVLLFVINILVSFDLVEPLNSEAGKSGWIQWIQSPLPFTEKKHWFLSLLPVSILCLCDFYISSILWSYGTKSSMVVHASCFNSWFSLFFGTLALAASQFFDEGYYIIATDVGMLLFFYSIIILLKEVDKEMTVAQDFDDFLHQVENMGDKTKVENIQSENNSNTILSSESSNNKPTEVVKTKK